MFRRNQMIAVAAVIILLAGLSCSGGKTPVLPPDGQDVAASSQGEYSLQAHNRYLWAYYDCTMNTETGEIEATPLRNVQAHYNILTFLENGPCHNCLRINHTEPLGTVPGWAFDVALTHPFPDPRFRGFDVRCIVIFRATWHWEYSDTYMSNLAADNPEVINADGLTELYWGPTEGSGPMGLQGYQRGRMATPIAPSSHLNGFVNYESDIADNTRNVFEAGDTVTRTIECQFPEEFPSVWHFGYAVDACWAPPDGTGEDISDFPPEANCPEPYDIDITEIKVGGGLCQNGGTTILKIRVYEHDPTMTYLAPTIEAPDLEREIVTADFYGYEGPTPVWHAQLHNRKPSGEGTYRVLVRVEDELNADAPYWMDLAYYEMFEVEVAGFLPSNGWAQTWGYTDGDRGTAVCTDNYGNIYVGGTFENAVDFDPDYDDVNVRTSLGLSDCFIAKYDARGDFKWVRSWGGEAADWLYGIDTNRFGEVYAVGRFGSEVDFDPDDEGEFIETASGASDAFVTKFNFTGNWEWATTWGGTEGDSAQGVSYDNGGVFVSGAFRGSTDFGHGGTEVASHGGDDAYLVRFDPLTGEDVWAKTWGGDNDDCATDVDYVYDWDDDMEHVYVCGYFSNYTGGAGVDFDPGTGEAVRISGGGRDAYVSKFDGVTGNHVLTYTWGAADNDAALGVNGDFINGWFVGGYISGVVDFDPSTDEYWSNFYGQFDAFLVGFEVQEDDFMWGFNWGGSGYDWVNDVDGDLWGNPFVAGGFTGTVDFDPTMEVDSHDSNGQMDCFTASYQVDGQYYWAFTWGSAEEDQALGICGGEWTQSHTTGFFKQTVDFSPEAESDNHTSEGADDAFLLRLEGDGHW